MVHKHTNKKRTNRQIDSVGKKLNKMKIHNTHNKRCTTRMWANAQRDGRPAEYRWRPLFNAAKFG